MKSAIIRSKENKQEITSKLNRSLSNNQIKRFNLNITNKFECLKLIFNLDYNLRNRIINQIIKFSDLFNSQNANEDDIDKLIKNNDDLIKKLSILQFSDNKISSVNLNLLDDKLPDDLKESEDNQSYKLNWSRRRDLIKLLIKNSVALASDFVSDDYTKNLIREDNNMVSFLLSLEKFNDNSISIRAAKTNSKSLELLILLELKLISFIIH